MSSLDSSFSDLPVDQGFATFFWHIYNRKMFTDTHFMYENSESILFSAHKIILALRSPYFEDVLYKKEKMNNSILLKDEINPRDFETMLKYMYDQPPKITTPKEACDIYKVAKEFKVISLMEFCQKSVKDIKIVPSVIFDMLSASNYLQNEDTKNKCLEFFQKNTKEVIAATETYDLCEISPSVIIFLLSSKKLSLDSLIELFEWVYVWAKNRSFKDHTSSTAREVLEQVLPHLPFESLSDVQFAKLNGCHPKILYDKEVISIFMHFAHKKLRDTEGASDFAWSLPYWYKEECQIEINAPQTT